MFSLEPGAELEVGRTESAVESHADVPIERACQVEQEPGLSDLKHHGLLQQHMGSAAQCLVCHCEVAFGGGADQHCVGLNPGKERVKRAFGSTDGIWVLTHANRSGRGSATPTRDQRAWART